MVPVWVRVPSPIFRRPLRTRPLTASVFALLYRCFDSHVLTAIAGFARSFALRRCDWWSGSCIRFWSGINDHKISRIPCERRRLPAVVRPAFNRNGFRCCPPVLLAPIPGDHDRQISGLARQSIKSALRSATHDYSDRFLSCHADRLSVCRAPYAASV